MFILEGLLLSSYNNPNIHTYCSKIILLEYSNFDITGNSEYSGVFHTNFYMDDEECEDGTATTDLAVLLVATLNGTNEASKVSALTKICNLPWGEKVEGVCSKSFSI